jgi:phage terminase large subunit-like protein
MVENHDGQVLVSEAAGSVRPCGPSTRAFGAAQDEAPSTQRFVLAQGEEKIDGRRLRRKYTEEVWALAEAEYFAGATALEIRAKFGMSLQTIYARMGGRGKQARAREEKKTEPARPEPRPLTEEETVGIVRAIFAEGFEGAAEKLRGKPVRIETRKLASGKIQTRVSHPPETWAKVRRDYEVGGFTVPVIAERYGIKEATIKKHASRGKWSKIVNKDVLPLKPTDDPRQITKEGEETKSAWGSIAHRAQLPPEGEWDTWLFQGGRGAGKTRAGAEWLADLAERTPHGVFALVGATENDVRSVMIEGPSGLKNLPGRKPVHYEPSLKRVTWRHNGAMARIFSAEEPERLRGPQFMGAWADEFAAWPRPDHTLAMLRLGLRLGADPKLVITTTPKPIKALRTLHKEASCVVTLAPTEANAANLSEGFLAGLNDIYGETRLAQQELLGELLAGEGALWTAQLVERARALGAEQPFGSKDGFERNRFARVVVGVDPPASLGGVCGIVVAARSGKTGVVLEDASAAGLTPHGWAERVRAAAERWGAGRVVAEANQGGEMVRATLASSGVTGVIQLVHARDGKRTRAEPVAALYEQGRVAHGGAFPQLEEEMMALGVEDAGGTRLDRADALVWALTALLVEKPPPRPGVIDLWRKE